MVAVQGRKDSRMTTVAVIGAGFSGTLLALHLLRRCPAGTTIKLIERSESFGLGMAYATGNPSHLLNVRVGGMSAFRDQPDHFLDWLNQAPHRWGQPLVHSTSFVPRRDFGAYVRALLDEQLERCADDRYRLDLVPGAVTNLALQEGQAVLTLASGRQILADLAILATGNVPALPPPVQEGSVYDSAFYRPDPWAADALTDLPPDAPVLLIGSGLTAMDVLMSLLDQGHTGPIHALSRRGLLPQRHAPVPITPGVRTAYPSNPLALLRELRTEARQAALQGRDWRAVVDSIRPFTSDIWQLMPMRDRAAFLRHLRPWWETHRHRMAPQIADRVDAARQAGQFTIRPGRIRGYQMGADRVTVTFQPRFTHDVASLRVARVINCSGPAADYERIADPMVRSLLRQGLVRPDPLRLGLDTTANCALRAADGAVSRQLFAVGPLTRSTFWEMTAVPDIRRQCEFLAAHIATLIKPASPDK
jgi:uncharacterized NAD(P)/FAD-binding protein YdhS